MLIFPVILEIEETQNDQLDIDRLQPTGLNDELSIKATFVPDIATFVLRRLLKTFLRHEGTPVFVATTLVQSGP